MTGRCVECSNILTDNDKDDGRFLMIQVEGQRRSGPYCHPHWLATAGLDPAAPAHDYDMPHDHRFKPDDVRHCPPNCPVRTHAAQAEAEDGPWGGAGIPADLRDLVLASEPSALERLAQAALDGQLHITEHEYGGWTVWVGER